MADLIWVFILSFLVSLLMLLVMLRRTAAAKKRKSTTTPVAPVLKYDDPYAERCPFCMEMSERQHCANMNCWFYSCIIPIPEYIGKSPSWDMDAMIASGFDSISKNNALRNLTAAQISAMKLEEYEVVRDQLLALARRDQLLAMASRENPTPAHPYDLTPAQIALMSPQDYAALQHQFLTQHSEWSAKRSKPFAPVTPYLYHAEHGHLHTVD